MEVAVNPIFLGLKPNKSLIHKQIIDGAKSCFFFVAMGPLFREVVSTQVNFSTSHRSIWAGHRKFQGLRSLSSGAEDIKVSSSSQLEAFSVTSSGPSKADELKISVEVSGAKTQEIFDSVFSKMVADAQPISGFRRVKGGQTPNIPRDILLEILGPSKVYKQVIKKIINSAVAEYVEKEGLAVDKDLEVEQSLGELEAAFEPGIEFSFDAVVQLLE